MASDQSQEIARVYAEALFAIAQERRQAERVRQELHILAESIRGSGEWKTFLETPAIRREAKAATLKRIFDGRVSDLVLDFLMVR